MTCFYSGNARHHHTVNIPCGDGVGESAHFCWPLHAGTVCAHWYFQWFSVAFLLRDIYHRQGIWTLAIALFAPFVRNNAIYIVQPKAFVMDFWVLCICTSFHARQSWIVCGPSRLLIGKKWNHLFICHRGRWLLLLKKVIIYFFFYRVENHQSMICSQTSKMEGSSWIFLKASQEHHWWEGSSLRTRLSVSHQYRYLKYL